MTAYMKLRVVVLYWRRDKTGMERTTPTFGVGFTVAVSLQGTDAYLSLGPGSTLIFQSAEICNL